MLRFVCCFWLQVTTGVLFSSPERYLGCFDNLVKYGYCQIFYHYPTLQRNFVTFLLRAVAWHLSKKQRGLRQRIQVNKLSDYSQGLETTLKTCLPLFAVYSPPSQFKIQDLFTLYEVCVKEGGILFVDATCPLPEHLENVAPVSNVTPALTLMYGRMSNIKGLSLKLNKCLVKNCR